LAWEDSPWLFLLLELQQQLQQRQHFPATQGSVCAISKQEKRDEQQTNHWIQMQIETRKDRLAISIKADKEKDRHLNARK
jgi:hypothetical protein